MNGKCFCLQINKHIIYCLLNNGYGGILLVNINDLTIEELSNGFVNKGKHMNVYFVKNI